MRQSFSLPVSLAPLAGPLAFHLLLTGCGGETGRFSVTVTDSAGVSLVEGPGEDRTLGWGTQRVLQIAPAEDEAGGFFGVWDVDVLHGDRILVLDGEEKKIVVFDGEGHLLAQYGREGSGPGEFQYPVQLAVTPAGGITVFDVFNRRLERFDSNLTPLAPDPLQVPYFGGHMAYVGPFLVLPTTDPEDMIGRTEALSALGETDTLAIVRYSRDLSGPVQLESCGMRLSGTAPVFAPTMKWSGGPGGVVAVVGTERYEVDIYSGPDFGLERRIRRTLPPIEATAAMARATVGDGMRVLAPGGERVCDADEVVKKRGVASVVPPISGVTVSPQGEIFLQRWAPEGEPRLIDVLTLAGEYVGTLPPGFPFPRAFLGKDRVLVTEEDELELTSLVVYRITR
ncbi:MAG: 6-bladed beta-propeller [Longimicrobiales bacterium]